MDAEISNPLTEDRTWFVRDNASSQVAYIGEASCTSFGTRLYQYLDRSAPPAPIPPARLVSDKTLFQNIFTEYKLPERAHAHLLIRVAIRLVGLDYHLMMRKHILDQLDSLYKGHLSVEQDPLLACRLFTIFALGELYTNRAKEDQRIENAPNVPGLGFFLQAMSLFQEIREEATMSYIEALLLISLYSLALNRANSAYIYAGIALRLGLTLGLHHNVPDNQMFSPLERERRIRVWWTVYVFDRNWSSKLGHPINIRDEDIDVDLPSMNNLTSMERAEFSEPEHLVANVQLARITGDIMNHIYVKNRQEKAFVQSVQMVMRRLRTMAETLPSSIRLQPDSSRVYPAKHVASLHLCFNQCVILTTRPILFHLLKAKVNPILEGQPGQSPRPVSAITTALADACIHAAQSSNQILSQLWVDGSLAIFGFFDAQYLFSSTLVLLIATVLRPDTADAEAVEAATHLLRSMSEDGNLPAFRYYGHLMQLRNAISALQGKSQQVENDTTVAPWRLRQGPTLGIDAPAPVPAPADSLQPEPTIPAIPVLGNDLIGNPPATNVLVAGSALDDPFIENFLSYSDFPWPATGEGFGVVAGNTVSPPQWVFEWDAQNQDLNRQWPQVREIAGEFETEIGRRWPRYYEEMKGIADGAQVDTVDVVALNVRTEIAFGLFSDGCTSLSWNTEHHAFLGQNWDWMELQKENLVQINIIQTDLPTIKMITEAGIIGKIGFNSCGMGVCLNAIRAAGMDPKRLPVHLGLRLALEQTSAAEAVAMLKAHGMASSAHLLVADSTYACGLEGTSSTIAEIPPDANGRIVHTNHLIKEHPGVHEPKWLADSEFRFRRMQTLIGRLESRPRDDPQRPTWGEFAALFEDQEKWPAAICRSPDKDSGSLSATLFNIVMDLKARRAVVRVGRPSDVDETIELDFRSSP
ncbi:Fungal specific transcription factor domain-containing protein [Cladophialophora immunda]|nr:Fungal specific transcription factor domain-containing protein [Cladophialophora immunda]